ncbi:hypothetical protein [Rhizobium terrae]|uniref:hypothetical protein n=1 Tax=Rhizobium terrae TaxID=2171756 RepID=UPI0013C31121|nr:hypothetical protein [Rhizobium terrae]
MKIVTHTEMLALPPGTVFSFFGEHDGGPQGEMLGSLYVKGETLRHNHDGKPFDFCILNMLPKMANSSVVDPKLTHLAISQREGTFDETRQFMVWSEDACRRLAQALLEPAKAYFRVFGDDDIPVTSDSLELINDYGMITALPKMGAAA